MASPVALSVMPDQSSKSVLILDHGLFLSWAYKLAEYFGEVSY